MQALYEALIRQDELLAYIDQQQTVKFCVSYGCCYGLFFPLERGSCALCVSSSLQKYHVRSLIFIHPFAEKEVMLLSPRAPATFPLLLRDGVLLLPIQNTYKHLSFFSL
jgi:hypothetical protein